MYQVMMRYAALGAAVVALGACHGGGASSPPPSSTPVTPASSGSAPVSQSGSPKTSAAQTVHPTESNPPGDIPDSQVFVDYSPPGSGFTVKIPEGWARSTAHGVTSFTDKLNVVRLATRQTNQAPTIASVRSSDVPALKGSVPKFALVKVSTARRAGQSVIVVTYTGDSAPNPVTGKVIRDAFEQYAFYHSGKRFDLTLSGPTNADNVDPWHTVSESVRWT